MRLFLYLLALLTGLSLADGIRPVQAETAAVGLSVAGSHAQTAAFVQRQGIPATLRPRLDWDARLALVDARPTFNDRILPASLLSDRPRA